LLKSWSVKQKKLSNSSSGSNSSEEGDKDSRQATFNSLFSMTTWVSRKAGTSKVKPIWILMKQEIMGWQWHQLDNMQIICTSLQTYNDIST